ncbi:DNA gyrase inhibitor [Paenibacillus sp. LMG 31460]|uniref:DNA gyrase inhibitor n=1 Tax=Paenibacillus germinis TaxID=2654979 RepID=A0ABX1YWH3_9BACL|nr:GyrI-like domain-containing protein [Paenibacillus germinis]NOU85297.1 DNA gyrase inhibitor [Paenibacillus germinis]
MNIKVETLPTYRIAYVRQVGPYGTGNIQAMEKLKKWAKEKNLLTESAIILGIPQDNPEMILPENCRYDACIVISNDYQIDNKPIFERYTNDMIYNDYCEICVPVKPL